MKYVKTSLVVVAMTAALFLSGCSTAKKEQCDKFGCKSSQNTAQTTSTKA